jgi:hypothetical protein
MTFAHALGLLALVFAIGVVIVGKSRHRDWRRRRW